MKKDSAYTLAMVTFVFAALLFGILIGRGLDDNRVFFDLPDGYTSAPTVSVDETQPLQETNITTGIKININTATIEELNALPGIGPVLAQAVIDYRTENGPYRDVSDLLNVHGLGQKTLDKILEYITVEDE